MCIDGYFNCTFNACISFVSKGEFQILLCVCECVCTYEFKRLRGRKSAGCLSCFGGKKCCLQSQEVALIVQTAPTSGSRIMLSCIKAHESQHESQSKYDFLSTGRTFLNKWKSETCAVPHFTSFCLYKLEAGLFLLLTHRHTQFYFNVDKVSRSTLILLTILE